MNVETVHLRWFEQFPKCPCGKSSHGILKGDQNQSYGYHCAKCARRRLKASKKARGGFAEATEPGL